MKGNVGQCLQLYNQLFLHTYFVTFRFFNGPIAVDLPKNSYAEKCNLENQKDPACLARVSHSQGPFAEGAGAFKAPKTSPYLRGR